MNRFVRTLVVAVASLALTLPATASANDDRHDDRHFKTHLSGFNEVHPPNLGIGAIFSTGSGRLKLRIDRHVQAIRYELSYDFPDAAQTPLVGTGFVNQAHLHFGQKHTTGGIAVWLCQGDNVGPAGTPTCPSTSGTVSGTILPANVIALPLQGLPSDFDALVAALRSGAIYANVHTDRFAAGEIRGHLEDRDDD
jgi:hypothetical protein